MAFPFRRDALLLICLLTFSCASCVAVTAQKGPTMEPGMGNAPADSRLLNVWELLYQEEESGNKKSPLEGTRTLLEFTDRGKVIVNRTDKDHPDKVANQKGTFSQENNEIMITDDKGDTTKWTYAVNGDMLTTNMIVNQGPNPKRTTFYWRRFK